MTDTAPAAPGKMRRLALGCGGMLAVAALAAVGLWQWNAGRVAAQVRAAEEQHARKANDAFEPVLEAMGEAVREAEPTYDIDKTIRVLLADAQRLSRALTLVRGLGAVEGQHHGHVHAHLVHARQLLLHRQKGHIRFAGPA